jgi:cytochrome c oxidase subunit 4
MFFMEVKYNSRLVWVFAGSSFVFLFIMLLLTMNDYLTRAVTY